MKRSHQITYFILSLLKKWISSISPMTRYKLSNKLAGFLYHYVTLRKGQAEINIIRAFPDWTSQRVNSTLQGTYQFFSHNFVQFIAFPKSWEGLKIDVVGKDVLDKYMDQGKGVIFITGHFGAWEILGKWLGEYAHLFTGVAHRQKNAGANRFFQEQRELPGTKHIFRREPLEKMDDVLTQNGILGLVSDQDAKQRGVFVNFFGVPASTPKGAALFHLKSKAPIMLGACVQTGFQRYRIELVPVIASNQNVEDITQVYTALLEKFIRQFPEQYFWFHRRWKTKLDVK